MYVYRFTSMKGLQENKISVWIVLICNMGLVAKNLSSGFPTKRVSNQSPQLQRLPRK